MYSIRKKAEVVWHETWHLIISTHMILNWEVHYWLITQHLKKTVHRWYCSAFQYLRNARNLYVKCKFCLISDLQMYKIVIDDFTVFYRRKMSERAFRILQPMHQIPFSQIFVVLSHGIKLMECTVIKLVLLGLEQPESMPNAFTILMKFIYFTNHILSHEPATFLSLSNPFKL